MNPPTPTPMFSAPGTDSAAPDMSLPDQALMDGLIQGWNYMEQFQIFEFFLWAAVLITLVGCGFYIQHYLTRVD